VRIASVRAGVSPGSCEGVPSRSPCAWMPTSATKWTASQPARSRSSLTRKPAPRKTPRTACSRARVTPPVTPSRTEDVSPTRSVPSGWTPPPAPGNPHTTWSAGNGTTAAGGGGR
jgi:hypothetical protein